MRGKRWSRTRSNMGSAYATGYVRHLRKLTAALSHCAFVVKDQFNHPNRVGGSQVEGSADVEPATRRYERVAVACVPGESSETGRFWLQSARLFTGNRCRFPCRVADGPPV